MTDLKHSIAASLAGFGGGDLKQAAAAFLNTLGYASEKTIDLGGSPDDFLDQFGAHSDRPFRKDKAKFDDWREIHLLFQLTDREIAASSGQPGFAFDSDSRYDGRNYKSYLFFALELENEQYTRAQLAAITREINRLFTMPVMVFFRHGGLLTLAVIDRRMSKKDAGRDVLEKVTLIKDIRLDRPHRAHIEILHDLSLSKISGGIPPRNFVELHEAWRKALDIQALNRKFYNELANWYFWALSYVEFPDDIEKDPAARKAKSLIRLLTRLVFCWFLKEKGLISETLFDERSLRSVLKSLEANESSYYRGILQNLFFGTLNQRMNTGGQQNRRFVHDQPFHGRRHDHGIKNLYRYQELFAVPENEAVELFEGIPFLNGGLFDCLDKEDAGGKVQYVDGFTRNTKKQPDVPNKLFFSGEQTVDLCDAYGDQKRSREKVRGLMHLLSSYKFTVTENTPIEEEIALDPELLGKVFESLLASYDPDTGITARKQTGSFYTPREIVNFMVEESLVCFLKAKLMDLATDGDAGNTKQNSGAAVESRLRQLSAYTDEPHLFSGSEVSVLINAIDSCNILDPACGSGAFPMGVLHKLVFILGKLDPHNERWKRKQLDKLDSVSMREELERTFANNDDDYGRKLHLLRNCIYGVDIQPIAIQISKLRFFISLICDQRTNRNKAQNCGIRPLPNLETKFVTANTLIARKREHDFFKDPRITILEKKLTNIRNKHFAAQRRRDKLALQQKDAELRMQISEILSSGGMSSDMSMTFAKWDPYDQNESACFFDAEWMFGVRSGFDIVIGNPPYGADIPDDQLKILKKELKDTNNGNSAAIFIDAAKNRLIKPTGVVAFIVPKSLMFSEKWLSLAQALAPKTVALVDVEQAFENVLLEQVVFVYDGYEPSRTYAAQKFTNNTFLQRARLSPALLDQFKTWLCDVTQAEIAVAEKMIKGSVLFSNITSTSRGLPLQRMLKSEGEMPVIGGKNVQPYAIDGTKGYLGKEDVVEAKRKLSLILQPKIVSQNIVAHIANPAPHLQIISALDLDGTVLTLDTVNCTRVLDEKFDLRFLVALLNSRLMSWFAYRFVYASAIRTMHFDNYYIGKLPVPDITESQQAPVIAAVDRILAIRKKNPVADILEHQLQVEQSIYKLFNLTPAEIGIVEGKR